jgi:hypothetical protein
LNLIADGGPANMIWNKELLQRLLDPTNQGKSLTAFAQRRWLAAALDHPPLVAAISSDLKINCNPQNADHAFEIDDI